MRKLLASKTLAGVAPWKFLLLSATLLFTYAIPAHADNHEEAAPAAEEAEAGPVDDYQGLLDHQGEYAPAFDFFTTSMLWTCIAAALVFLMHLGFAT
ncbi:MAG: hypothetical protein VXX28_02535, partial [Verrucomicrobiota bacterium]|nr:hypothetical protein [Verrucomicrobiota bacterium]